MAKAKQQTNNANTISGKTATPVANAPVKPASTKETAAATQAAKAAATVAAAPTREVQSAGKNADKNAKTGKNANTNATPSKNVQNTNANVSKATNNTNAKAKNAPAAATGKVTHRTVGVSFVLRLVLGLAPEKRAECQLLREILTHENKARLVLTPSSKGLQAAYSAATNWAKIPENEVRVMARQAQSDKFQEAMQQLNGEYLYDAIRTQLIQAGGASVWETIKDKHALQAKNIRPRSGSGNKNTKPQKETGRQQAAKKSITPQVQSVKKNVPMGAAAKVAPPPAPVNVKSATNAPAKKEAAPKGKVQQAKNAAPEKNTTPVKNAAPVKNAKNATPAKNASATIGQNQPGAIVGGARGGRAVVGSK